MGAGESAPTTGTTTGAPARVSPGAPGGSPAPSTVQLSSSPIVSATWEKKEISPIYFNYSPTPPAVGAPIPPDTQVKLLVTTKGIADGTQVTISVRRCETQAEVPKGALTTLVVRGNRVVDPTTNDAPNISFTAEQKPYEIWNQPFFYFRVTVSGAFADSPRDHKAHPEQCLRVKYLVQAVAEASTMSSCRTDAENIRSVVNEVEGGKGAVQDMAPPCEDVAAYAALFRNTYAVHVSSHGNCIRRDDESVWMLEHDLDALGNHPVDVPNPQEWKGVTCARVYIEGVPGPSIDYDFGHIGKPEITESVPAVLFYGNCCLTGYESSFADAMINRGCRWVLLFRKVIYDFEGNIMAKSFWSKWADEKFNPDKVPDCFFRIAGDHYATMRPVLYPLDKGGRAPDTGSGGVNYGEIAAATVGIAMGIALGVLIWAGVTKKI
jgi:hypothetical protein